MNNTIHGDARIRTVKLGDLRVSPVAQRELNNNWSNTLAETFDINKMGTLVVSHRDGIFWIVDGQHRASALRKWAKREFGDDWTEWTVEVRCHEGLDEVGEAQLFLALNSRRPVSPFDNFKVGVTAEIPEPSDVNRIVMSLGLKVAREKKQNTIAAVSPLMRIYRDNGAVVLRKTLTVIRDAWEGIGFDSAVIDGVGMFIGRYEGRYSEERLLSQLSSLTNGSRAVLRLASALRDSKGHPMRECVAAAITSIYNKGLRGKSSLGSWWREDEDDA